MSTHTYLDLVNKVMTNLRETNTLTSVNANGYAQLIGEFVNQAKETVEDSWRWGVLTSELQFVTNLSQQVYYLDNTVGNTPLATSNTGRFPDERSYILKDDRNYDQCFDITLASSLVIYQMTNVPRERAAGDIYLSQRTPSTPYLFSYAWEYSNVGNKMRPVFYMVNPPLATRTVAVRMFIPQPEFVPGTDELTTLLVPWRPVVSLATALAMQERGEELGQSADLYMARYNSELFRAQELDHTLQQHTYDQLTVDRREGGGWSLT